MPVEFGLSLNDLSEGQMLTLLKDGNSSAKTILKQKYRNNAVKLSHLNNSIKQLESGGIKFNSLYDTELSTHQVAAILLTPKKKTKKLPLRSLMHPSHNKTLNDKLSRVWWEEKIQDYEKDIRYLSMTVEGDEIDFTTADIRKIKFGIVWLNFFMSQNSRSKLINPCLSKHAQLVFLEDGFSGLYKIAKSNKRQLKKYFSESDEGINRSFYELASLDFRDVWEFIFTPKDRKKLIKSFQMLGLEEHAPASYKNLPIYYLYNNSFNMNIQKLKKLFNAGYKRMKTASILRKENEKLLSTKGIFEVLHKNFSKYKS